MSAARPSGDAKVMQARDAEHGVVDPVALQAAVAENLPGLQAGEDVLDAGADLLVGCVLGRLPAGQVIRGGVEPGSLRTHPRHTINLNSVSAHRDRWRA